MTERKTKQAISLQFVSIPEKLNKFEEKKLHM